MIKTLLRIVRRYTNSPSKPSHRHGNEATPETPGRQKFIEMLPSPCHHMASFSYACPDPSLLRPEPALFYIPHSRALRLSLLVGFIFSIQGGISILSLNLGFVLKLLDATLSAWEFSWCGVWLIRRSLFTIFHVLFILDYLALLAISNLLG